MLFTSSILAVGDDYSWVNPEEPGRIVEPRERGLFFVLVAVGIVVAVFLAQLLYTFKVLFTLAIIEASPAIALPLDTDNRKAADVLGISEKQQYTTSSICGTLKYLRTQAGVFSAWRGFSAAIAHAFAVVLAESILQGFMGAFLPGFITRPVASVLSTLLLARFSLAVTHIIISRPQPTWWLKRVLATPWSSARQTLPALGHFALAKWASSELFVIAKIGEFTVPSKVLMVLLGFAMSLFVVLPLWVGLVRVQASLLPDTEEAIISFDRTFGKEGGILNFKEAVRSVKCQGWQRLMKLAGKMVGVVVVLAAVMGLAQFALFKLLLDGTKDSLH